jgi:hypothetical protein
LLLAGYQGWGRLFQAGLSDPETKPLARLGFRRRR